MCSLITGIWQSCVQWKIRTDAKNGNLSIIIKNKIEKWIKFEDAQVK